jgi:hypothetical protein
MSKRIYRFTLSIAVILGLSACSADGFVKAMRWVTYTTPVDETELNTLLSSGTRLPLSWANGEIGTINFYSSGSATADIGGKSVNGNWQIQGGKLCTNWDPDNENVGQCYTVYHARGGVLKMFDEYGAFYAKATVRDLNS